MHFTKTCYTIELKSKFMISFARKLIKTRCSVSQIRHTIKNRIINVFIIPLATYNNIHNARKGSWKY